VPKHVADIGRVRGWPGRARRGRGRKTIWRVVSSRRWASRRRAWRLIMVAGERSLDGSVVTALRRRHHRYHHHPIDQARNRSASPDGRHPAAAGGTDAPGRSGFRERQRRSGSRGLGCARRAASARRGKADIRTASGRSRISYDRRGAVRRDRRRLPARSIPSSSTARRAARSAVDNRATCASGRVRTNFSNLACPWSVQPHAEVLMHVEGALDFAFAGDLTLDRLHRAAAPPRRMMKSRRFN
jgi:hypothetical protein